MSIASDQLKKITKRIENRLKSATVQRAVPAEAVDADDVPVGMHGILASTEKLLAVNRGLIPTDERDSQEFKRVMTTDKLMRERVRLDADKTRLNILRRASKTRNLKGIYPTAFDAYTEGHIVGNPLSSPLEEINPVSLVESANRITQMGPGGLGSTEAITDEARALHPSQFGFIDAIAGPESERIGIDTRATVGAKIGSNGSVYQRFLDRRSGKHRWMSPQDTAGMVVGLPD
jgi:DNA-directed RNA polymerase beta subunit